MLFICNMLLVTVVLFGRSHLYVTDPLLVELHVKFSGSSFIILSFAGASVITGVSRSKAE